MADGSRSVPDLEDRAGRYGRRHNLLTISVDSRTSRDIVERWVKRYRTVPGAKQTIEDRVSGWWQRALVETILGVLALRGTEYWDERAMQAAL